MNFPLCRICSTLIILVNLSRMLSAVLPGPFVCTFAGQVCNSSKSICIDKLPSNCSSFILDGIVLKAVPENQKPEDDPYPQLKAFEGMKKPMFVFTDHGVDKKFKYDDDNIEYLSNCDLLYLQYILKLHPTLSGVFLKDVVFKDYSSDYKKFAERFVKYLTIIKTTSPDFTIGLCVNARDVIDNKAMNMTFFDQFISVYILMFNDFNVCTEDMKKGGIIPMEGTSNYTLTKLNTTMNALYITDKKEIYFNFLLYGVPPNSTWTTDKEECTYTYENMCNDPANATGWCMDTSETLRLKGKFVKDTGGGFIVNAIDVDDPDNECNCSIAYPGFNYLIEGYTGVTKEPCCPLFDRTPAK